MGRYCSPGSGLFPGRLHASQSGSGRKQVRRGGACHGARTVQGGARSTRTPEDCKVAKTSWPVAIRTTGTVDWDADHTTQAITQVNGPISRILVDFGAQVSKDQPLLYVSSPDVAAAMSAYRKARNREVLNKRIVDRTRTAGARLGARRRTTRALRRIITTRRPTSRAACKCSRSLASPRPRSSRRNARAPRSARSWRCARRSPARSCRAGFARHGHPGGIHRLLHDQRGERGLVQGHIFDHDLPSVRVGDPVELTNPSFDGVRQRQGSLHRSLRGSGDSHHARAHRHREPARHSQKDMFGRSGDPHQHAQQHSGRASFSRAERRQQ